MNLPNTISLARLLSVPFTIWLLLIDQLLVAFVVFLVAGISDAVDGLIAKRTGTTTELGRYLDPLADKVLLVGVYVTLGMQGHLPVWLVILVAFRDFLIVGGALLLHFMKHLVLIDPLRISKANTALQIILASVVLGQLGLEIRLPGVAEVLIAAVAATTVLSGATYLITWGRRVSSIERAE